MVLVNQLLLKLKIVLRSKYLVYGLLVIALFYTYLMVKYDLYQSKYTLADHEAIGIVQNVFYGEDYLKISLDEVLINYYFKDINDVEKIEIGDKIKVTGSFSKPKGQTNFFLFNYANYLKSKKVYYLMDADNIVILSHKPSLLNKCKRQIINRITSMKSSTYLKTFILGDNSGVSKKVKESYQTNGISHLFAVSGMHVTLLTGIILYLLEKVISKKRLIFLIVTFFLFFYMFLTNFSPSIIRATFLFILCYLNKEFSLGIKTEYILLYIFIGALFYNPFYVYNSGFLFS